MNTNVKNIVFFLVFLFINPVFSVDFGIGIDGSVGISHLRADLDGSLIVVDSFYIEEYNYFEYIYGPLSTSIPKFNFLFGITSLIEFNNIFQLNFEINVNNCKYELRSEGIKETIWNSETQQIEQTGKTVYYSILDLEMLKFTFPLSFSFFIPKDFKIRPGLTLGTSFEYVYKVKRVYTSFSETYPTEEITEDINKFNIPIVLALCCKQNLNKFILNYQLLSKLGLTDVIKNKNRYRFKGMDDQFLFKITVAYMIRSGSKGNEAVE